MQDLHDLEILLDSRIPLVVIETHEELRALQLIVRVGLQRGLPVFAWSCTEGWRRADIDDAPALPLSQEPEGALRHVRTESRAGIWVLCDFHPYLQDAPRLVRWLREIAMHHERVGHSVIFLSHALHLPPELARYSAQMSLSMPTDQELLHLVREEAARWSAGNGARKVRTDNVTLNALVANLRGLSTGDARRLARGAICNDGAITLEDLPDVARGKFQLMRMDGVLNYEYDTTSFAEVGGLSVLKQWLGLRREVILQGPDGGHQGLDFPRGVLLLGVQGSGKSLAARASAGTLGLPLLRLDMAALYNKYIGETERNLRESLRLADIMSPCVLWIDEIEKGLGSGEHDNGVSRRVLGTLLTWMAERKSRVFLVATSNDVSGLPPELIRKGRFDEIFFVDLPGVSVREQIFSIHLARRGQPVASFNLAQLAAASEGFSGAEIEQSVVAALYLSVAEQHALTTAHVLREIVNTAPLSVVMAEKVEALRVWAKDRTVLAD